MRTSNVYIMWRRSVFYDQNINDDFLFFFFLWPFLLLVRFFFLFHFVIYRVDKNGDYKFHTIVCAQSEQLATKAKMDIIIEKLAKLKEMIPFIYVYFIIA